MPIVAPSPGQVQPWPYALAYGNERKLEADVLVIGGGIAGVWAAISAARCGARVSSWRRQRPNAAAPAVPVSTIGNGLPTTRHRPLAPSSSARP